MSLRFLHNGVAKTPPDVAWLRHNEFHCGTQIMISLSRSKIDTIKKPDRIIINYYYVTCYDFTIGFYLPLLKQICTAVMESALFLRPDRERGI